MPLATWPTAMNDCWYFANKNQAVGPFKLAELKALMEQVGGWEGLMVWGSGFSQWQRAADVPEILALFQVLPPPLVIAASQASEGQSGKSKNRIVAKAVLGILLLAAAVASGAFGQQWVRSSLDLVAVPPPTTAVADLEKGLAGALVKIRMDLPKKIDPTTILTGVRNEGTKMIFDNLIIADGDKFDDVMKEKLRLSVVKNVCGGAETRRILDIGGSFRYLYANSEAKPVMSIDVDQRSCS